MKAHSEAGKTLAEIEACFVRVHAFICGDAGGRFTQEEAPGLLDALGTVASLTTTLHRIIERDLPEFSCSAPPTVGRARPTGADGDPQGDSGPR